MKKNSTILPFAASLLFILSLSCNQSPKSLPEHGVPTELLQAPANFFDKPGEYLEWQTKQILNLTDSALLRFPPQLPEPLERQMAMLMLDAVFHDVEAPNRPSVQDFHQRRTLNALNDINNTEVNSGAMIWKLYNMGFVVRTKTVTVGFDITRGYSSRSEDFALPDNIIQEIADQCDVLFISHRHRDHADEAVARIFTEKGKPVVAPPDIWSEMPIYNEITHLERKAHEVQLLPVQSGNLNLEVVVYPGNQNANTVNNVTLIITPEGFSVCHTGDQALRDDFVWIDEVSKHFKVDVLIPNCWTTNPLRTSKGYNPKLIIPAHENELGHTIDHREAYALNYSRWNIPYPKILMTWGESYHYNP
jgi:L-ascorbate metabolism protein UlaG (beta-lactamase superfamily)